MEKEGLTNQNKEEQLEALSASEKKRAELVRPWLKELMHYHGVQLGDQELESPPYTEALIEILMGNESREYKLGYVAGTLVFLRDSGELNVQFTKLADVVEAKAREIKADEE
jgi:hypothetical protein